MPVHNHGRPPRWYNPIAIGRAFVVRPRLLAAIAAGILAYVLLPHGWTSVVRSTLSWDLGALVYLAAVVVFMASNGSQDVKAQAASHDESAIVIPIVMMAAIAGSFLAVAGVLTAAKAAGDNKAAYLILAGATIIVSWLVMQVVLTIHYAHEYYAPHNNSAGEQPLSFAGKADPDYWDFLYFSATIGATSQTSDTAVCSPRLRRLVTAHGIVSFFFNTIVLALTINLAAGLI